MSFSNWLAAFALVVGMQVTGLIPSASLAQNLASNQPIQQIVVEGTQRIEPESVRSYLTVKPGDVFDPIELNQSLKAIFSTGLFADVSFRREGATLVVNVVENPIINRVAFEGNRSLNDEVLGAEATLRSRSVYTRTKAQADAQRLLQLYRRSGRFAASVEPKIIQLPQNRVDLVFEISEGEKTFVNAINFIGNRAFDDDDLRDVVSTSETAFYKFLSSSDSYDPDRLTFDRELLRRFYLKNGYADFDVLSVVAELTPDRKAFLVTFTLEEGNRYRFGSIEVESSLKDFNVADVQDDILTVDGEYYNANLVDDTVSVLTDRVGELGYAFVNVNPQPDVDKENRLISLLYSIDEGPRVFVERIDIEGNVRTLDRVIRREFELVEGDAFNAAKLRRSRERIQRLGFFRTVNVDNVAGSTPDKTIVKVEVEDQSTGELSLGAGFSSSDGPLGSIGLRERNFLGRGQDVRIRLSLAGSGSQADFGFTEPYFMGKDISAGFDVFRIERDNDELSFDEVSTGGALRTGFNLSDDLRQLVNYRLEFTEVSNIDSDASLLVREQEGDTVKSAVGTSLIYDKRDTAFNTKEGYVVRLDTELAGLGGDVSHLRTTLSSTYFTSFFDDEYTLSVRGEVGNIIGLAEDTRISERYFLGGNRLRGFENSGVGPRDSVSDDPLGGKQLYNGSVELSFPLGLPEEFPVKGRLFADFGATFNIDGNETGVEDESTPRLSIGPGISYDSPFGPLRADVGIAILKEDFDETEVFSFNFGTNF
ncbi:outer membrane protein assembly factor BamA [Kiloniella sp. b19]|uniref:outer membrane protein assembly factor BamA n=1 Tax=Kiloniella sp. GXU_MW_B19 TaxID=3141326 RepID=UPI0031DFEA27